MIDTTTLNVHELKRLVARRFVGSEGTKLGVTVVSFGFRFGIPTHADLVLDVRFLPNPFFIPELKPFPGTDPRVSGFVLAQPDARAFLDRITDLLGFLLPRYRGEGKSYLTIGDRLHRREASVRGPGGLARGAALGRRAAGPALAPRRREGVKSAISLQLSASSLDHPGSILLRAEGGGTEGRCPVACRRREGYGTPAGRPGRAVRP